ncbi:Set1/Ash2 histone methyltransferase complex subunit ASH2, partial [Fragariocoptes setiger]
MSDRQSLKSNKNKSILECHPTKDGFKYHCVEDDPLCSGYIEKFLDDSGKRGHIPAFIKRKILIPTVRLSPSDCAQQLKLSDDNMRVTGEKGYCMIRATHSVNRGKWYYEATIESMPALSATRIGWGQVWANLQAPLGYDDYGYSWRSRLGTKFHKAHGKTFDKNGGYREGDTVGCMIELPYGNPTNSTTLEHLPVSVKESAHPIYDKKKTCKMLEEILKPPSKMKKNIGSKIKFYRNGQLIGTAFEDISQGFYFPTISLYRNATVSVNFGAAFKYPPSDCSDYRAMQEAPEVEAIDITLADMIYLVDNKENFEKDFS